VGAQRLSFVPGSEQSAALQDWNDFGNEHIEHFRQDRRHQVESVSHITADPIFHEIGDLLRRALEDKMAARAGEHSPRTSAKKTESNRPASAFCVISTLYWISVSGNFDDFGCRQAAS
jgi:hypothetical protein